MYESSEFLRRRQRSQEKSHHSNDSNRQRQDHGKSGTRSGKSGSKPPHKIVLVLASLAGMCIWYTTPVSDWLTTFLLLQVPVEADIALGRASLLDFQKTYPETYHTHWSPLVEQIGHELIRTLEKSSSEVLQEAGSMDFSLDELLGTIGLAQSLRTPQLQHFQWDFGVVRADIVNAFALPGGIIRVTDKLLETLSPTRGELASLLGHEIGHCFFRHSQRRIVQQKMFELVIKALTYEDHDDDDETFGEALGELLLKGAHWFGQQKFSREDEYQADATGWALLLQSQSYNPKSVQSLLTKLWTLNGKAPTTLDWMSTHPATEDRIEALRERWQQLDRRDRQILENRFA